MGIGEDHPVGAGDEARSLALLLLNRGAAAEQTAEWIHHPPHRIDANHRRSHPVNGVHDEVVAGLQGRTGGGVADARGVPAAPAGQLNAAGAEQACQQESAEQRWAACEAHHR